MPLSCRVASACAVDLPLAVATSFPGLRPPRLDMNGAECLKEWKQGAWERQGEREVANTDASHLTLAAFIILTAKGKGGGSQSMYPPCHMR